jgi:6-phosphogluconolactonase/glucosamine-6-phosphate isomerase/deaminase
MQKTEVFQCGGVRIEVAPDEATMGRLTAEYIIGVMKAKRAEGVPVALWLMAAPSAFAFYKELITTAERDATLRDILRETHFFQFDDYPISRQSPKFKATFRYLLESNLFEPLAKICGKLQVHPLELNGTDADAAVMTGYRDDLLALKRQGVYFIQLKGIGMDGHWGFHGAETPLDAEPGMITVPMHSQNVRQQMLDWPEFFPTAADVPQTACTFNVGMFLKADEIVDNVPQAGKAYSVLAAYGTEAVINAVPSSAIKRHPRARAYLTAASASALLEFRRARQADPKARLSDRTLAQLRDLWRDPKAPDAGAKNIAIMEQVLRQLGMI